MEKEKQWQVRGIELVTSENLVCRAVLDALGSPWMRTTNKKKRKAKAPSSSETAASLPPRHPPVVDVLSLSDFRSEDRPFEDHRSLHRSTDRAAADLAEALHPKDEALKHWDSLQSEMSTAEQMLVSGIHKISGKVSGFKNFADGSSHVL